MEENSNNPVFHKQPEERPENQVTSDAAEVSAPSAVVWSAKPQPSVVVPPSLPQSPVLEASAGGDVSPVPVVKVLSPRGVEYVFLIIALLTSAISLGGVLISFVNAQYSFSVLAFPVAGLVVAVPVFTWLFLRLKKAEFNNPQLKLDASKRRSTQFTQIITFLVSFFTLVGLVYTIFSKIGGSYTSSMVKVFLDVLVIEVISCGILFYYWRDEHLRDRQA